MMPRRKPLHTGNMPRIGGHFATAYCERVARRGGNYNNTSNAGMAYLNCNNPRGNANANYGGRLRSRSQRVTGTLRTTGSTETGGVYFHPGGFS